MTLNKILVFVALILALLAALIGTPEHSNVDLESIAAQIESEKDHLEPTDLAEMIVGGKKIRLIDLRDSASYTLQHIFNAEIMSLTKLVNGGVKRNEVIVLYSEGGIHASQAWMMLKMKRYDSVYTLLGGFAGWKNEILFPTLSESATKEDSQLFKRKKMLAHFFGGTPKIISKVTEKEASKPQKQQPALQHSPVIFQKEEEKLREGC